MERRLINNVLQWVGFCPVPRCQKHEKGFTGDNQQDVNEQIRQHLRDAIGDATHSEMAEKEGWFDTDPLGD